MLDFRRKLSTLRRTRLLKPVLEDSHRLSFICTHKDLLLYLMLDKAAKQFLKQKYADELELPRSWWHFKPRRDLPSPGLYWLYPLPEPAATCSPASASRNSVCVITRENIG